MQSETMASWQASPFLAPVLLHVPAEENVVQDMLYEALNLDDHDELEFSAPRRAQSASAVVIWSAACTA